MRVYSGPDRPWHRRDHETIRAYNTFRTYLELPRRSILAAATETGHPKATVTKWSVQHRWVARALAYDNERAREIDSARRDAIRSAIRHSEEKRIADKERAHKIADLLAEKIEMIAGWPVERFVKTTESVDGRFIIQEPIKFVLRDLGHLTKAYSDLRRYAFDLDLRSIPGAEDGAGEGGLSQAQVNAALTAMANEAMRESAEAESNGNGNGNGHVAEG